MTGSAFLVWTEDRAAAEAALPPSPEALQMLGALRALHRAEAAQRRATSPEEADAGRGAARAAQAELTRWVTQFCAVAPTGG